MPHVVILPHVIDKKLKEDERKEVIDFINGLVVDISGELKNDILEIVEERFARRLSEGLVNLKLELVERISSSETLLNEKITNTKTELVEKIANSKAETIKWMFIFWLGSVITIVGGMVGILKIAKVF